MDDRTALEKYFRAKQTWWETLCKRCGGCCGSFDDPCIHLKKDAEGCYFCEIYASRFGTRKTVEGEEFDCVPINEIIDTSWKKDWLCAYKRRIKIPG